VNQPFRDAPLARKIVWWIFASTVMLGCLLVIPVASMYAIVLLLDFIRHVFA
jgi:hypothetical protein